MKMRVVLSTAIHKPIREVFERFADPEFNTAVDPNSEGAKLIEGKAFSQGAVYRLSLKAPFGGSMEQIQTFTEYEAPDRFTIALEQKGFSGIEIETFEGRDDGAVNVTWDARWDLSWWMVPLYPLVRWKVKSGAELWIALMKETIEAGKDPRKTAH